MPANGESADGMTRVSLPARPDLALVTGANSGIGKAVSVALAREKYRLILLGRDEGRLIETQKECNNVCSDAVRKIVAYDLTDTEGIAALTEEIAAACDGTPGVLVHCAGTAPRGYIADLPAKAVHNAIALNTSAFIALCGALLPAMRQSEMGRIVAITSGHALLGLAGFAAYSAAKAGLERIMQSLKAETASTNIEIALISPGLVASGQTKAPECYSDAMRRRQQPPKRTAEEVAEAVVKALATGTDVTLGAKQRIARHLAYWAPGLVRWAFSRS
ncbi:MAG: SDR family oxidoreductase [Kiloniellales bacterium]|nr:SDR family oxidoreductase [Kiloniellales bacterium]